MTKKVLDVGNCDPDHAALRTLITGGFGAQLTRAYDAEDAWEAIRRKPFDLVIVNRKFDRDGADGIELIRQLKADPEVAAVPVMLLSNYAEYQQQAVAAGAVPGFGKRDYDDGDTHTKLSALLS